VSRLNVVTSESVAVDQLALKGMLRRRGLDPASNSTHPERSAQLLLLKNEEINSDGLG